MKMTLEFTYVVFKTPFVAKFVYPKNNQKVSRDFWKWKTSRNNSRTSQQGYNVEYPRFEFLFCLIVDKKFQNVGMARYAIIQNHDFSCVSSLCGLEEISPLGHDHFAILEVFTEICRPLAAFADLFDFFDMHDWCGILGKEQSVSSMLLVEGVERNECGEGLSWGMSGLERTTAYL